MMCNQIHVIMNIASILHGVLRYVLLLQFYVTTSTSPSVMDISSLDLLYAGLSAAIGTELITPQTAAAQGIQGKVVSIDDVFEYTYIPPAVRQIRPFEDHLIYKDEWINIKVKTLIGMTIRIKVKRYYTIDQVKRVIEREDRSLAADRQKLVFNSRKLSDEETVEDIQIQDGDTIFIVMLLRGGGPGELPLVLDQSFLDSRYNFDFMSIKDRENFWRGEYEGKPLRYYRPCGWYRYALKVQDKYGDNSWLGGGGIRTQSTHGEWPVSYHGTKLENASGIVEEGFRAGPRQAYGAGVYSSPHLEHVESTYAQSFKKCGKAYKIVFQIRVNPHEDHLEIFLDGNGYQGVDYWVSTKHDIKNSIIDIRPYGILIKPCASEGVKTGCHIF